MKRKPEEKNDLEECERKIYDLLKEYNCTLTPIDEWDIVSIRDNYTDDTIKVSRHE